MSEVVFVGTSDAFGAGGRRQSAVLVRGPRGGALLDCGATTGGGLVELGVDRNEIDAILISHFHGDHFAGIPILLMAALYEDERRAPIRIAGPAGIEERVRTLAAAMGYAMEDRQWSFPIEFQELAAGASVEVGPMHVGAFQAYHQVHTMPHGLLVETGAERIAYSGDTGWFPELPARVGEADLFICECTYHTNDFEYHLNHAGLVARRSEFHCNRIILTHLGEEMAHRRGQAAFETADDRLVIRL